MAVIPIPLPPCPLPPSSMGRLWGGPALAPPAPPPPPAGGVVDSSVDVVLTDVGTGSPPASVTPRCSGDEWMGELLFLLEVSPLPFPRDEVRGETRPVWRG